MLYAPELNAPISCASSTCNQARLVRTPSQSLNSCFVWTKFKQRNIWSLLICCPNFQFIIVSSRGQVAIVKRPFDAANFLLVRLYPCNKMLSHSHVSIQNGPIFWASTQHVLIVPRKSSDSALVAFEGSYEFLRMSVPQLNLSRDSSSCKVVSSFSGPANGSRWIIGSSVFV